MKRRVEGLLRRALEEAKTKGALGSETLPPPVVEIPKDASFGDLATPVALSLARSERKPPRQIAESLRAEVLRIDGGQWIASAEVAGPGFLNFRLTNRFWAECLGEVERGLVPRGVEKERILVEFVSGNPTGPLHVGHGRGAVTGDVLSRLLEASGYEVSREYYVNDAGNQIDALGRSAFVRLLELYGGERPFPEDGYPGEYLRELVVAEAENLFVAIAERTGAEVPVDPEGRRRFLETHESVAVDVCGREASRVLLDRIREDLALCEIRFDRFVSERALRESGAVGRVVEELRAKGLAYESDGALWFRSTAFGDEKDRVLVRQSGELTYFACDIAYHLDKLARGYEKLVNVWGADHHGYLARLRAALRAFGHDPERLQVVFVQIVNLTRGGRPVRMGKRSGEFVSLREVLDEVGVDATRFFFLMRKSDSQLEFDLELAKQQSTENPVYYVQYVHARCASLFRQAEALGVPVPAFEEVDFERFSTAEEGELVRGLAAFGDVVEEAAGEREPHRVVFYLVDLAGRFHRFYNRHRVLGEDRDLARARLYLCKVTREVVARGLGLLGVRAPDRM
ncbi:MAG: arginine--tRNA ligase [Candidatus Binatia bacterium]|nr:MAG: arginine--tRNA ligase [Candidatus Binatia bacterium]